MPQDEPGFRELEQGRALLAQARQSLDRGGSPNKAKNQIQQAISFLEQCRDGYTHFALKEEARKEIEKAQNLLRTIG